MFSKLLFSLPIIALLSSVASAEGLLYQLPDDGHWVRFEMIVSKWKTPAKSVGKLTLSSVGTEQIDGRKCRWIEIDFDTNWRAQPNKYVCKLLIPEEHLGTGKDPLKHLLKACVKKNDAAPLEGEDLHDLLGPVQHNFVGYLLHGPFKTEEKLEATDIDSHFGKLNCHGIRAIDGTLTPDGLLNGSVYVIRLHDKSPFGVVTMEHESKKILNLRDGPTETWEKIVFKVADAGVDAKSKIPPAK